ncbi:MAG: outer membrane beta-barrel protein [Rickettsiales bacterium]|jgi:opacity protein-like surface antigen|nr:outer membrane beta-barrel protein [Rickettsiales bacterium]
MRLKNIILAGILSTTALTVSANENAKDFYAQLNAGVAYGQKPKGDFSQGTLSNSPLYGFAVGYKFYEGFRADLSLDYRSGFNNNYIDSEVEEDGDTSTTSYNINVKSLAMMANFYYDVVEINGFTPYITTGLGVSRNTTGQLSEVTTNPSEDTVYVSYPGKIHTDFAWKVGLGSTYKINQNFDLDIRYQYADLGKFKTGNVATLDGSLVETERKTGKIKSHEVLMGIAYKF